ncbi:DNA damage-regulated autophagy modulator protein 2-like [Polypterus senegalus]|nr:DNA damage-regulated autophagy modulator protein 2-like [Polypterus senegalus]
MWWFQEGLCCLPVLLVVWSSATFIFSYITAVVLRHVDVLVPYISDTGTTPPERCLFGIMLNISSFLGMATIYVRYKQVEALNAEESSVQCPNKWGLALGLLSSVGLCIVANFQKSTIIQIHVIGAALTFGAGAIYILLQIIISFRMQPHLHSKKIFWIRTGLGLWCAASILSMLVSSVITYRSLPGVNLATKLHWDPNETGYTSHLVSTISEWLISFSFLSFFLTYIRDFQKITLRAEVSLRQHTLFEEPGLNWGERTPILGGHL